MLCSSVLVMLWFRSVGLKCVEKCVEYDFICNIIWFGGSSLMLMWMILLFLVKECSNVSVW